MRLGGFQNPTPSQATGAPGSPVLGANLGSLTLKSENGCRVLSWPRGCDVFHESGRLTSSRSALPPKANFHSSRTLHLFVQCLEDMRHRSSVHLRLRGMPDCHL